uniref:Peptidase A1 domain-containing protein n=1 Tax=Echinococcus canadensis TaxID=519352 RepID=A0A915EYB9_9CEST
MLSFIGAGLRIINLNSHLVSNRLSGENIGFQINLPTCGYPSFWFDVNPKNTFDGQRSTKSSNFTQNSMYRYFITYFDLSTSLRVSPLAQMQNVRIMDLSVLSSVTVILNYVLQCINGGLLNVFFTPTYNQTSKQTTYEFGMNQDRLMKYVKGVLMISGKNLPLDVLKTFPESIGGGDKGVKEAQENPNREVIFIIGPVAAAIIMLIAILGLILISFCTCTTKCCHSHKKKKPKSGNRENKLPAKSAKSSEVAEVPAVEKHKETHQDLPYKRQFDNGYDGYPYYGNEDYKDSGSDSDDSEDDDTTTSKDDDPK